MNNIRKIRKISIGMDYKNAMHYIVGQSCLGGTAKICEIVKDNTEQEYVIWIKQGVEIFIWKGFNFNLPIGKEYDINF